MRTKRNAWLAIAALIPLVLGNALPADEIQAPSDSEASAEPVVVRNLADADNASAAPASQATEETEEPAVTSTGHSWSSRPLWIQADYLTWWIKGNNVPALVTTSPPGTPRDQAGVMGFPDTQVLHGNEKIDENHRFGGRLIGGWWLDDWQEAGFQGHWFSLGDGANDGNFFASSTGDPILARPFFNVVLPGEDSELVAYPGVVEGSVQVLTSSEMHSAGIVYRRRWRQWDHARLDWFAGYRFLRFREALQVTEDLVSTDPGGVVAVGTTFDVEDRFLVENDFHGGDMGVVAQWAYGCLDLEAVARLALGNMRRQLDVDGRTVITDPTGPSSESPGGLLALPTNMGRTVDDEFAMVPELSLNARYRLTDTVSLVFGYNLLYMTDVLRTGDQIDRNINPTQLPGGGGLTGDPRPAPRFNDTSLWAQGVNFGIVLER